jgi:uncharacterized membrane protein
MVNSLVIVRGRSIPVADYSQRRYAAASRVYGVDTAIVIVVFAALAFWACVGTVAWLYL